MCYSQILFDAHVHLQDSRIVDDALEMVRRARLKCVENFACCGTREADWPRVESLDMAVKISGATLAPSFGLHPWFVKHRTTRWLEKLEEALVRNPHSGVGEIGLDAESGNRERQEQMDVFLAQLKLARRLCRPVSIHCRKAWQPLMQALKASDGMHNGFMVHSYSGSSDLVKPICEMGGYISFAGSLTNPRNRRARAACVVVPENRLLAETDAPNMLPAVHENSQTGSLNQPANLVYVLAAMACCRAQPFGRIAEITTRNARRLFGLIADE